MIACMVQACPDKGSKLRLKVDCTERDSEEMRRPLVARGDSSEPVPLRPELSESTRQAQLARAKNP
jgi:hypothetical protein